MPYFSKVVFLDVDNVLNTEDTIGELRASGHMDIDGAKLGVLQYIVEATAAHIVVSSFWRLYPDLLRNLTRRLGDIGIDHLVVGSTCELDGCTRASEISEWLNRHEEVKCYAILDDQADAGVGHGDAFFHIDGRVGLTWEIAGRATNWLNGRGVKKH